MRITESFCENLRNKRKERGLTQERLAQRAGISYNFISQLERGMKAPTLRTVEKLADALDLDPLDLFQPTNNEEPSERKMLRTFRRIKENRLSLAQKVLEVFAQEREST